MAWATRYGGSQDVRFDFGYTPASQIRTRGWSNDAYASNTAYEVSRSYAVNGLNQHTAAGPATLAYDANGTSPRMVRRASPTIPRTGSYPPQGQGRRR